MPYPQTMFRDGVLSEPYFGGEASAVPVPRSRSATPRESVPRVTI
jgi:hypothetical protein